MSPIKRLLKTVLAVMLAAVLTLGIGFAGAEEGGVLTTGASGEFVSSKYDANVPSWAIKESRRYSYDFSEEKPSFYNDDGGIHIYSSAGFAVKDGVLTCAFKKSFALISDGFLGDDYGIGGGDLSFRLSMKGGKFSVILRDTSQSPTRKDSYLNFDFNKDGTIDVGDYMAKQKIKGAVTGVFASGAPLITFEDHVTYINLLVDGKLVLSIDYIETASENSEYSVANYECRLVFKDGNGNVIGTQENSQLQRAGRFVLSFDDLDGYMDDLSFDRTVIDQSLPDAETRVIDYSNWVATDDLGRVTALNNETGAVKQDKCVGIFYFLCWVGAGVHVQDNTKLFLELGIGGLQRYLTKSGGEAYWAEPFFGYYRNTDTWVYRKHAYMLDAAGIDFIFLDISNGEVFTSGHLKLFDTWLKIRQEGGTTPQICFLCGDTPEIFEKDLNDLRKSGAFTEENLQKYDELFFKWDGKPLIFGNTETLSKSNREFLENFEVRGCWAWQNRDGYWNWIEELDRDEDGNLYMYKGRNINGTFEQLAVALGHHPASSKGRSFVLGSQNTNGQSNFEFYLDTTPKGTGFASQAEYVLEQSPRCVLITGWNEWIAGNSRGSYFMANTPVNDVNYVDQFNPEFSRDGEPMKIRDGVGFGDNYYYQIIDFVRRYKGMGELKKASGQEGFDGAGAMDSSSSSFESVWNAVGPEYRDTIGDVEFRNTISYDAGFRYLNGTGRNDLESAKVSRDEDYLYFTVKTVHDVETAEDSAWMNLFIDTDFDHNTGWEGYDYVVNRYRDGNTAYIEKLEKDSFVGIRAGEAQIAVNGNRLTLKIAKSIIGVSEKNGVNFDFKWADNSTETGNVMSFMDLGDTAPNDRFNFRFVGNAVQYEKKVEKNEKGCGGSVGAAAVLAAPVLFAAAAMMKRSKKRRTK